MLFVAKAKHIRKQSDLNGNIIMANNEASVMKRQNDYRDCEVADDQCWCEEGCYIGREWGTIHCCTDICHQYSEHTLTQEECEEKCGCYEEFELLKEYLEKTNR